ncbi:MAG: sulfotransferase [Leptolyngbya sp. SIO3F4]|nr:sulfotransferase [Leptolyngbya sp. SIO3F4]
MYSEEKFQSENPLKAIIGAGRSGTTWLGSIIDSHPEVVYRFEPFHRLKDTNADFKAGLELFSDPTLSDKHLDKIYQLLIEADPLTCKPPFFQKNSRNNFGIKWMWGFSRKFRATRIVYKHLYTPKGRPPVVFKEVTYERHMKNLLTRTSMPITYLVRHPCGTMLSEMKGQATGQMPTGRQAFLGRLLKAHDSDLHERYEPMLDNMSPLEKSTLLWRLDLEKGVSAIKETNKGLLLTYEQLCDDPYTHSKRAFEHFGLKFEKETEQFIDNLCSVQPQPKKKFPLKGDWMRGFFTVYRNPKTQKNAWKKRISSSDRKTVEKMLEDSEAFQYCAALGGWD